MGCFWDLQVSKCLCIYLFVCACIFKPSADFLCSAPEIEASPVDEPELSPAFWVVWAADKQRPTYFPDCGRGSFRSCSSLLCYWDNKGALISSCHGSLCREGAGWCNAARAAPAHTYLMRYGRERLQSNNNTTTMILWGIIIFIINMITVTIIIILCMYPYSIPLYIYIYLT